MDPLAAFLLKLTALATVLALFLIGVWFVLQKYLGRIMLERERLQEMLDLAAVLPVPQVSQAVEEPHTGLEDVRRAVREAEAAAARARIAGDAAAGELARAVADAARIRALLGGAEEEVLAAGDDASVTE